MERLYRTVVQLEEAKKLVQQGDVAHLRLALILLDNAVEVMMHRVIEGKMMYSDMYARMLENFSAGPLDPNERFVRSRDTSPRSIEEKFASSGAVSPDEVTDEREEFSGGEVFTNEAIHMVHGLGSRTRVDHDRYIHFYLLELSG